MLARLARSFLLLGVVGLASSAVGGCRPGDHPPEGPAGAVADWLVDKLYVEVRQAQAIEATVGPARERIAAEQAAVEGLRGGQAAIRSRVAQVFWERVAPADARAQASTFVYRLTFKAAGGASGMQIEKEVTLGTTEPRPGIHRVQSIHERDLPGPVPGR